MKRNPHFTPWNPHGTPLEPSRNPPGTPPVLRPTCCALRGILRICADLFCNALFSGPYSAQLASMYARSCEPWPPEQLITMAYSLSRPPFLSTNFSTRAPCRRMKGGSLRGEGSSRNREEVVQGDRPGSARVRGNCERVWHRNYNHGPAPV